MRWPSIVLAVDEYEPNDFPKKVFSVEFEWSFINASLDKSSENNERMIAKIEVEKNVFVYVVQIAGLIARRIKCNLTENQSVKVGERYGIIRFGSRLDVYVPENFNVKVKEGQLAISGETILADFVPSKSK